MAYEIDLSGRTALITGASSGLGAQFARCLARAGAVVVLASRRVELLLELQKEIKAAGGVAHVVSLDVTQKASIDAAIGKAVALAGPLHILINNSGVSTTQKLVDVSEADFDLVFDTNTKGAFFVAQAFARHRLEQADEQAESDLPIARIVNIASMAGLRVLSRIGVYCMSKAAVIHMTRAMALEWGRHGINVNAIAPGYIDTEINHAHWQTESGQKLVKMLPRKRVGKPEDLDVLLVTLCAGQSHFVNGAVIAADDGFGL